MKEFVSQNLTEFTGEILDETKENFLEQVQKHGVTVAPVLILFDGETEVFRGSEPYEITDFLATL
ncbi:hypothetical protein CSB37_02545 [bacterium DOLZORAL124_38_8]|nr:MAG: hypothetical protein CSB37_02545 [bacterium DOLZORAL124_38_8]